MANFEGAVRTTLPITYNGEMRDLKVTFGLIDRIRQLVDWEKLAIDMGDVDNFNPNFSALAKFVYFNLLEAGFDEVDIDDIYDEMLDGGKDESNFITLASQLIVAYQPRGKKKQQAKLETVKPKKKTKKA